MLISHATEEVVHFWGLSSSSSSSYEQDFVTPIEMDSSVVVL